MSPLFGKQAAKLFLEEEYRELERKRQLLKSQEERTYRDIALEKERALQEIQQKTEWFDSHKRHERNSIEREKEKAALEIEKKKASFQEALDRISQIDVHIANERAITKAIAEDAMKSVPYVAEMLSDCKHTYDLLIAQLLENKAHPAMKAADTVREYSKVNKSLENEVFIYKHRLSILEEIFPWLDELFNMSVSELAREYSASSDSIDPVKHYVTTHEYYSLTEDERNQLALDRYLSSHRKSKWAIGRDYELYIGHVFEKDGYNVEYTGSLFRFDDLGRDLVVRKDNRVLIVQCKFWSKEKKIHEKHIFQLFGTSMCYQIDHPDCQVSCVLVTNTVCSDTARAFASKMSVTLKENVEMGTFPRIKCNISDDGERIYHLPMDQQYDNVVIDKPGEFFAMTVQEAVNAGFRRAYRWHGA